MNKIYFISIRFEINTNRIQGFVSGAQSDLFQCNACKLGCRTFQPVISWFEVTITKRQLYPLKSSTTLSMKNNSLRLSSNDN